MTSELHELVKAEAESQGLTPSEWSELVADRLRKCLAEAGYDPQAVYIDEEGEPRITLRSSKHGELVPDTVAMRAFRLCGAEMP